MELVKKANAISEIRIPLCRQSVLKIIKETETLLKPHQRFLELLTDNVKITKAKIHNKMKLFNSRSIYEKKKKRKKSMYETLRNLSAKGR